MSSPHLAGLAATSETKTPGTEKVGELYVPDKSQLERFAAARDAVGGDDPWRNFEGPQVAPPWQEPRSMADAMSGLDAMRDLRWWTDFAGRLNLAHAATEMPEALKSYLKWGVENLDYPPAFVQEIPQLVDMVRSGLHTAKVLPSYFPDVSVPDAKHPTPMESLDYLANVLVPGYSLGTQWENMTSMERGVHIAADSLLTFILLRVGASLAKGAKGGSGQGQLVKQTTPSLISRRVLMKTIQAQAEGTPRYRPGALGQGPWPSRAGGAPKVGVQGYRPGALGQGPWPSRAGGPSILGLKGRWRSPSGALGQGPWPSRPGGPSILGLKGRWRSSSGALGQGPRRYRPGALGKPRLGPPASDSGPRVTQERLAWEERVRQRAAAEEEMLRRPGGLAEYQKLHQSREAQRLLDIREDAIRKRLQESPSRATAVLDNPSRVPELSGPGAVKDAELLLQELSKQRGIQAAEQVLKDLAKQRASKLASRRAHMAAMQGQVEGAGPYRPRVKRQFAENSKAGGDIIDRSIAEGGPEGTLIAPPLAAALHQEPQARRPDDGRTVEGHPSGVPGPQLDDAIGAPASEPTQKPDDDMALPLQDTGILLGGAPLARMSQGSTKPESGSRASPKDDPSFQPGSVPYVHPADTGTDTEKGADGQNTEPAIVPYVDPADTGADTDTGTGADDETVTEPNTEPAIFPYVDPADTGADTDTGTGADDDTDTGTDDETVTELSLRRSRRH